MCDSFQAASDTANALTQAVVDGSAQVNDAVDVGRSGAGPASQQATDLDLSHLDLNAFPNYYSTTTQQYSPAFVRSIALHHNRIMALDTNSFDISIFQNLVALDLSNNLLLDLPESCSRLMHLQTLIVKNNRLNCASLPKTFGELRSLRVLNLSGNEFEEFPPQILELCQLKTLYLGSNQLHSLPCQIGDMTTLETLYLGGNLLREVPATIGRLLSLTSLTLCDNKLETIPSAVANLRRLYSLSLHNNRIRTLPTEIATLPHLKELSLRGNPLVVRFVRDMTFDPPTLKELSGRVVKIKNLSYQPTDIPASLCEYLQSAHQCVNPKCKGVYFQARVEHIKFVDFCGKYRVPLFSYLCSPKCCDSPAYCITESSADSEDSEDDLPVGKLKKILLG